MTLSYHLFTEELYLLRQSYNTNIPLFPFVFLNNREKNKAQSAFALPFCFHFDFSTVLLWCEKEAVWITSRSVGDFYTCFVVHSYMPPQGGLKAAFNETHLTAIVVVYQFLYPFIASSVASWIPERITIFLLVQDHPAMLLSSQQILLLTFPWSEEIESGYNQKKYIKIFQRVLMLFIVFPKDNLEEKY